MSYDGMEEVGLKKVAKELVKSATREIGPHTYEDSVFDEVYSLDVYTLPDGTKLYERAHKIERSYDGCNGLAFLALQNESGEWIPKTLWSPDEIRKAICNHEWGKSPEEDGEYWLKSRKCRVLKAKVVGTTVVMGNKEERPLADFEIIKVAHPDEIAPYVYR